MSERYLVGMAPLKVEWDIARASDGRPYNEAMGLGGVERDDDYDSISLPGGIRCYANCGIVGIDAEGRVYGGYDHHLDRDDGQPLNENDRRELAALMIERWRAFGGVI